MLTIADLMQRELITVAPGLTLRGLVELLAQSHISGAPVLEGEQLVGVVTASDVMSYLASLPGVPTERTDFVEQDEPPPPEDWTGDEPLAAYFTDTWDNAGAELPERFETTDSPEWDVLESHTVAEAMTRAVVTLESDTDLSTAARTLVDRRIHRILVATDGTLEGILTTTDLVRAIADGRLVPAEAHR
jgi:CBS domain-containing protein